jgi:phosphoserine phosphatase
VGDSSNDLWIAKEAGFTVGLNPKTAEFEEAVDAVVRSGDLQDILPHLLDR